MNVRAIAALACAAMALPLAAQQKTAEQAPAFEPKYLSNAENVQAGKRVWDAQCTHCHGANAYPGKAPKLRPGDLDPEFIYDRVTNGFGKMPPWKDVFDQKQRMAVVAYIKSEDFAP